MVQQGVATARTQSSTPATANPTTQLNTRLKQVLLVGCMRRSFFELNTDPQPLIDFFFVSFSSIMLRYFYWILLSYSLQWFSIIYHSIFAYIKQKMPSVQTNNARTVKVCTCPLTFQRVRSPSFPCLRFHLNHFLNLKKTIWHKNPI